MKVKKTSNNLKSRVIIMAKLGLLYSPYVAISVMLRINDLWVHNDQ